MVATNLVLFWSFIVIATTLLMIVGLHFALERPYAFIYRNFRKKTVKILVAALVTSHLANLVTYFQPEEMFTGFIYGIEGASVGLFQYFTNPLLTSFFVLVYLILYPALLILTYFKLHSLENGSELKYAGSYILLTAVSAPFFLFFPVEVTGYYLDSISPLLYEFHPVVKAGITAVDPLTKAMPSLHTGFSVLTFFYANKYTNSYSKCSLVAALLVITSTFYLGVHWFSDALVGFLLSYFSYWVVDRGHLTSARVPDRLKEAAYDFLDDFRTQVNPL